MMDEYAFKAIKPNRSYTWEGEPIETLSHEQLCKVVGELIDRQTQDRSELLKRRLDAIWVVPESMRGNVR